MWDPGDGELGTQEKRGARKVQEGGGGGGQKTGFPRWQEAGETQKNLHNTRQHYIICSNRKRAKRWEPTKIGQELGLNVWDAVVLDVPITPCS